MAKRWQKILVAAIVILVAVVAVVLWQGGLARGGDDVVLDTGKSVFTREYILARIDLTCRKYGMTSDELYEDPGFWNQMVNDIVFEYAGAEIAREYAAELGFEDLTSEQREEGENYAEQFYEQIATGDMDRAETLASVGFTEESLLVYGQNQVYEAVLKDLWAQSIELSQDATEAEYQKMVNYSQKMKQEIEHSVEEGKMKIDLSSLLQSTEN